MEKMGAADNGDGEKHFEGCRSPDDAESDWLKPEAQVRERSRGRIGLSMELLRSKIAMSRINRKAQKINTVPN